MAAKNSPTKTADAQLAGFLAKFAPDVARTARAALAKMRKFLPGANRLVYDNYNALAIGFAFTERTSDCLFSIAVYPRWVSLFLYGGPKLSDPGKLLRGGGTRVRHIVLESAADLDRPAVRALMTQVLVNAGRPSASGGKLVIKSVAATQRPRRPAA